ncbi:MAG: GAF domain-containing protein [Flavobacteriales bacterium]|nr:GAF domain-containing protein [Flavobacteriales bacterium]
MSDTIHIVSDVSKEERYAQLYPQLKALLHGETDLVANLSNTSAVLKQSFKFLWVGFYLVKDNELVLGPFQGEIACTRIGFGKGVYGTAWQKEQTIIVSNVDEFVGHIACSSRSKSEIVIPIMKADKVVAVLDIDSDKLDDFSSTDQIELEKIVELLIPFFE